MNCVSESYGEDYYNVEDRALHCTFLTLCDFDNIELNGRMVVARWTGGNLVEWLILHLGHGSR